MLLQPFYGIRSERQLMERKRQAEAVRVLMCQGMRASIREIGQPCAIRSRVCVSQACGSTSFIFAVCRSVAMVAQVRPPPWLPAKSAFFLVMVCGRIARPTVLESISIRPSLRKRSRAVRLDVA